MSHGNGTSKGGVCNDVADGSELRWDYGLGIGLGRLTPRSYALAPSPFENHSNRRRDQFPVTVELLTIRQAIEGDEAALRALWTRHAPHIDLVVRRLVGHDQDLAADIAQEVWIQIFRALPSYRGDSQVVTWAHRIAVNRTLNALRKTRRLAGIESDIEEDRDRKSTRLNSSHLGIPYAVFCL